MRHRAFVPRHFVHRDVLSGAFLALALSSAALLHSSLIAFALR